MKRKLLALFLTLCLVLPLFPAVTLAEGEVVDELTRSSTGATTTAYISWTATGTSGTVYAGQSAGGNESIQMRSNNSNSGIVSTESVGIAKKVSVDWNEATAKDKVLVVYGKTTPYDNPTDLYNASTRGTELGRIELAENADLEIEGDYTYIGLRSASGAVYLNSISITWEIVDTKYTVSFDANGGSGEMDDAEAGLTFELPDCTFTPPDGMVFAGWKREGDETLYQAHEFAEISGDTVFAAQWKPAPVLCTISFDANGGTGEMPTDTIEAGDGYVLPECSYTAPTGCIFCGWKKADTGEVYAEGAEIVIDADTTFTAQWIEGFQDTLNNSKIGVSGTTYSEWSGISVQSNALYAGQSAGGNSAIQMRSSNSNSGIITTTSGGKVRKIAVVWNENTAIGRTLDIYGKNTPYTSAEDLYDTENKGTKLGSIVYGTSTSIFVIGDYKYIGLRSKDGALYLNSVLISWENTEPSFATQSLVLSGQIGVNFYVDLSMLRPEQQDASFMTFTVGKGSKIVESRADFDASIMNESGEFYGFTCYVNAIEMADDIQATFHYSSHDEEKTVARDGAYCVRSYITKAYDSDELDETTKDLVKALADYGHFTQLYLKRLRGWDYKDYTEMTMQFAESFQTEEVKEAVAKYAIIREHQDTDIEKITFSLVLDSETAIRIYYKAVDEYAGDLTATVDGTNVQVQKLNDGRFMVEIPNISAHELGQDYTVVATTKNGTATTFVSALSYVQGMLAKEDAAEDAKNAVCAIYYYYQAADAYLKAHQ